jgi:hypothetical protein
MQEFEENYLQKRVSRQGLFHLVLLLTKRAQPSFLPSFLHSSISHFSKPCIDIVFVVALTFDIIAR